MNELTFSFEAHDRIFDGHFPARPVVPGVVQLDRLLKAVGEKVGVEVRLLSVENIKFTQPVVPGDQMLLSFEEKAIDDTTWQVRFSIQIMNLADAPVASAGRLKVCAR